MLFIWTLPYVGLSYTGQQIFTWTEQTTPIKPQPLTLRYRYAAKGTAQVTNQHTHGQQCVYTWKSSWKLNQHNRNWKHAARQVFFRQLHLIALYSRQEKFGALQQCFSLIFLYLLTPQSRVLLQKLTGCQLVKKFPTWNQKSSLPHSKLQASCPVLSQIDPVHATHPNSWRSILTLRRLMSYIYGAPILDVSRSHTTTQHSR